MKIVTKAGSATSAKREQGRGIIIAHLCNSVGAWGAGFVLAVDQLSTIPRSAYRALGKNIKMGFTQFVEIEQHVFVANMIAQTGIDKSVNGVLVDYAHLRTCLDVVFERANKLNCDVHIPAGMGSGLAGGDKAKILSIIKEAAGAYPDFNFPTIYLWEFDDKSAISYVPTSAPAAVLPANPTASAMDQSLARFSGLADDLATNTQLTEKDL